MKAFNITIAVFGAARTAITHRIYQYSYGQILQFKDIDLPNTYEVHFSNTDEYGEAKPWLGDANGVEIPPEYLISGDDIYAWVFLHAGEDDGETVYKVRIPVIRRAKPIDEPPTPVEQSIITQAIAALNHAVEQTTADVESADAAASDAESAAQRAEAAAEGVEDYAVRAETAAYSASRSANNAMQSEEAALSAADKAEGEADRAGQSAEAAAGSASAAQAALDEFTSVTATATTLPAGSQATAQYESGLLTFGIPTGATGAKGDTGATGPQGFSPSANVTQDGKVTTITVTDESGTTQESIDLDDYASEREIAAMPKSVTTQETDADLYVSDTQGNALIKFSDGHIETKKFNSANVLENCPEVKPAEIESADLDVVDISGNVILRLEDGYIKTKKFDSTDEFEVPEYYFENGYIDAKVSRIKELLLACGGDAFIFCTDQHIDKNARQSYKLINYISKRCRINKLFMGGDLTNGCDVSTADEFRRAIGGRAYFANGNHEYMDGGTDENLTYAYTASTDDEVAGEVIRRYYWVDNPKQKIRYIVTDGFKENETSTSWAQGFEADQMTWLTTVAMNVPAGWKSIIFSHMFYMVNNLTLPVLSIPAWTKTVLDAIDASAYASSVLCIIQGHTHLDGIRQTDGGIPIIITTSDKYLPANGEGMEPWLANRVLGTVTEQAFDVVIADMVNNKITAVRIGGFNTGNDADDDALFAAGERVINL